MAGVRWVRFWGAGGGSQNERGGKGLLSDPVHIWSHTDCHAHTGQGCGLDPTPECHWTWGATENWVTEYYPVSLSAGTANFEISITNTTSKPGMAPLADRILGFGLILIHFARISRRWPLSPRTGRCGLGSDHFGSILMCVTC